MKAPAGNVSEDDAVNYIEESVGFSIDPVNDPMVAMRWAKNGASMYLHQTYGSLSGNIDDAINSQGQSVGQVNGDAVLWSATGAETDLASLLGSDWTATKALGINHASDIFGEGDYNGIQEAFELIWHPATSADTAGHYTAVEHHNILAASAIHG